MISARIEVWESAPAGCLGMVAPALQTAHPGLSGDTQRHGGCGTAHSTRAAAERFITEDHSRLSRQDRTPGKGDQLCSIRMPESRSIRLRVGTLCQWFLDGGLQTVVRHSPTPKLGTNIGLRGLCFIINYYHHFIKDQVFYSPHFKNTINLRTSFQTE